MRGVYIETKGLVTCPVMEEISPCPHNLPLALHFTCDQNAHDSSGMI